MACSPFQNKKSTRSFQYYGSFKLTADRYGIAELLERWVEPFTNEKGEIQIIKLSQYLDLVRMAGLTGVPGSKVLGTEAFRRSKASRKLASALLGLDDGIELSNGTFFGLQALVAWGFRVNHL